MERNQDIRSFPQSRWVSRHFQLEQEITNTSDLDGPFSFSVLSAEVTQEGDTLHAHICCDVFMTPYQLGINWSSWMFDGRRHTIWMFLSATASCYGRQGNQFLGPNNDWHCIVLTGTGSSGEHCTEHWVLKHTRFSVLTRGRGPQRNSQPGG